GLFSVASPSGEGLCTAEGASVDVSADCTGTEVTSDISNAASKSHHTFSRNKFVSLVAAFKIRTVSINSKILSNLNEKAVDKDLPVEEPIRKTSVNIRKYL
ncbi:hypothetical protein, partial [Gluconobacter japonicus]